jgi:aminoglycoside phosphotransferase (APT) family kinase protein
MKKDEKTEKMVFIHGDLNIGNIILDEKNDIKAIIDYSFSGVGDIYSDISIILCRVDDIFSKQIVEKYENSANIKLNREKLFDRIRLRKYIEEQYKNFMVKMHPEVKF